MLDGMAFPAGVLEASSLSVGGALFPLVWGIHCFTPASFREVQWSARLHKAPPISQPTADWVLKFSVSNSTVSPGLKARVAHLMDK